MIPVTIRKDGKELIIMNRVHLFIATVTSDTIQLIRPVTPEEIKVVAWVSENFQILIDNIIEE